MGSGTPWALQVQALSFAGGVANGSALAGREVAYYKVDIPTNTESWKLHMVPAAGHEALMLVRKDVLPNMAASSQYTSDTTSHYTGTKRQKTVQSTSTNTLHMTLMAQRPIPFLAGTYYVAVVSEGQNPPNGSTLGSGAVDYTLTSHGVMPIADATATVLDGSTNTVQTWSGQSVAYGEQKVYRFRVDPAATSVEVRLNNRVGDPIMAVHGDAIDAGRIPAINNAPNYTHSDDYDAEEMGQYMYISGVGSHYEIVTAPDPDGDYTVVVTASKEGNYDEVGAQFDLEVTATGEVVVPFNGGSSTVTDQESQAWRFFRVDVPPECWDGTFASPV